ncbi:MAG: hypothetical protein P8L45_10545 [Longimicrobiales bacterium]|nr:hypothetical protein [Longimicrobiales bacterium]
MKPFKTFFGVLLLVSTVLAACEVFEDQTPQFISFAMDGPSGAMVQVIYSKAFVAGVDEAGTTRVEVFESDTVLHTLPIDTVIDVRIDRRLFIQGEVSPLDTLSVDVEIDVDGRSLFDGRGDLFPDLPWRFLYQFNSLFTDDIEVII